MKIFSRFVVLAIVVALCGSTAPALAKAKSGKTIVTTPARGGSVSGSISGAAGLTKSGAGTLTVIGSSSYSGTTTLSSGTLTLTADNTYSAATTLRHW